MCVLLLRTWLHPLPAAMPVWRLMPLYTEELKRVENIIIAGTSASMQVCVAQSSDLGRNGCLFTLCAGRLCTMLSCSRAGLQLALAALGTLACVASASQWVVETNSFRIKEPSSAAGEFDAAIGDVRAQLLLFWFPPCCTLLRWHPYICNTSKW